MQISGRTESGPAYQIYTPGKNLVVLRAQQAEDLRSAARIYNINSGRHPSPIDELISSTVDLLRHLDISPFFTSRMESSLMAIAIGKAFRETTNDLAQSGLIDSLKLVATGYEPDGSYGTLSGFVREQSLKGLPEGYLFDPKHEIPQDTEKEQKTDDYFKEHLDLEATKKEIEEMSKWGPGTKLHVVRRTLGIKKETEKPVKVMVLNKSGKEMITDLGFSGMSFIEDGKSVMVMGNDYQSWDSTEHEYAHAQSSFPLLRLGFGILFRGVVEAATELFTSNPQTYLAQ